MNDWKERALRAEAERDAALAEVTRADHVTDALIDRARQIGMSVRTADPSRYAGWTEDQWLADAVAIMDSIDGSCAELVNGHVHALISKAARAESAEAALARLRKGIEALHRPLNVYEMPDEDAAALAQRIEDGTAVLAFRVCEACAPEHVRDAIEDGCLDLSDGDALDAQWPCPTADLLAPTPDREEARDD